MRKSSGKIRAINWYLPKGLIWHHKLQFGDAPLQLTAGGIHQHGTEMAIRSVWMNILRSRRLLGLGFDVNLEGSLSDTKNLC